jgi:opacity protein-like surface antigen
MRIPSIATLLVLPLVGATALAANDDDGGAWYLQFGVGYNDPADSPGAPGGDLEFDEGFTLNGLIGYQMPLIGESWDWALELEGYFTDFEIADDGFGELGSSAAEDTSTTAILANAMLEWQWTDSISLYGGGGLGYAPKIEFDSFANEETNYEPTDDSAFAFQGKIGLRYDLGGAFSWLIGYRYLQTEDIELRDEYFGSTFDMQNEQHVLEFGLRWSQ